MLSYSITDILRYLRVKSRTFPFGWRSRSQIGLYQRLNLRIGKGSILEKGVRILGDIGGLKIGRNVSVGPNTVLIVGSGLEIHDNVLIGPNCTIAGGSHSIKLGQSIRFSEDTSKGKIVIGYDSWLGANCVVLDGVHIGEKSVVGAGSVVTNNTLPDSINLGVPSKFVKWRI